MGRWRRRPWRLHERRANKASGVRFPFKGIVPGARVRSNTSGEQSTYLYSVWSRLPMLVPFGFDSHEISPAPLVPRRGSPFLRGALQHLGGAEPMTLKGAGQTME